jgi:hypothetical protein
VSVDCEPFGAVTGQGTTVGGFKALVSSGAGDSDLSAAGTDLSQTVIDLTREDIRIEIYAPVTVVSRVETSIGAAAGSC